MNNTIDFNTQWITVFAEANRRIAKTLDEASGLTVTQYRILLELQAAGGILPGVDFAHLLLLKPSSVTCALKLLEEQGLIEKRDDKNDRRAIFVSITMGGEAVLTRSTNAVFVTLRDFWKALSNKQVDQVIESTRAVTAKLKGRTSLNVDTRVQPFYITAIVMVCQAWAITLHEEFSLSFTEFRILQALIDPPKHLRGVDLAAKLILDTSAVSMAITKLEKRGLVIREKDRFDKRNYHVELTKEGSELEKRAFTRISDMNADLYSTLSKSESRALSTAAEKIYRSL